MSEELKSAREFYHLLYDLDPEEAIPLMEARDKLIEEAALRRAAADRPNVVGAKPVCFYCSAAGIINCSHFDNCAGKWVYKPSAEHDREIERKARQPLIEALLHVLAIAHFTNLDSVGYGDKSTRTIIEEALRPAASTSSVDASEKESDGR